MSRALLQLNLDTESDRKIRDIWEFIAEHNISRFLIDMEYTPHITLGVYDDCRDDQLIRFIGLVQERVKEVHPFSLNFTGLNFFTGLEATLYFSVEKSNALKDCHAFFHEIARGAKLKTSEYYMPNKWLPHCTLAMHLQPSQVTEGLELINRSELAKNLSNIQVSGLEILKIEAEMTSIFLQKL